MIYQYEQSVFVCRKVIYEIYDKSEKFPYSNNN